MQVWSAGSGKSREMMHARKSTAFLVSSGPMAARLSKRCKGDHVHKPLNGKALAEAAFYPSGLRLALLRGMRDTLDQDARELEESIEVTNSTMMAREPGNATDRSISSLMRREQESKEEKYKVA